MNIKAILKISAHFYKFIDSVTYLKQIEYRRPYHISRTYGDMEVKENAFLTSKLDRVSD